MLNHNPESSFSFPEWLSGQPRLFWDHPRNRVRGLFSLLLRLKQVCCRCQRNLLSASSRFTISFRFSELIILYNYWLFWFLFGFYKGKDKRFRIKNKLKGFASDFRSGKVQIPCLPKSAWFLICSAHYHLQDFSVSSPKVIQCI